jgi:hypothetical protein
MAQTQTQVQYPVRAVTIDERVYFTELKLQKPQYAPFIPAIQATMNQYIVPYSFLAHAYVRGFFDDGTIGSYTQLATSRINQVLSHFGVTFSIEPSVIFDAQQGVRRGLRIKMTASKGGLTLSHTADLVGAGPDFGPVYAESKDLAVKRWKAYTEILKEQDVPNILYMAAFGYELFMTEGTPTPRQLLAAVKHKIKLTAVNPSEYIKRIREAVEKYAVGYTYGIDKYSYISRWVMEGLRAAFHATRLVLEVL